MAMLKVERYTELSKLLDNGYIPKVDEVFMWNHMPVLYISHEGKFMKVNDAADGHDLTVEIKDVLKLDYVFK